MKYFREMAEKKVREEIAHMVAQAGMNSISLRGDKGSYTGTYWVSANDLYRVLTGRQINDDLESGRIPANQFFDEMNEPEVLPINPQP